MKHINLEEVLDGFPGLSKFKAGVLLESCVITLHKHNHKSGLTIKISGDFTSAVNLYWSCKVSDQLNKTYADQQEATEYAAECLAILFSLKFMNFTVIERSVKGTGIDYWLGMEDDILFQRKARLEISGIFDGDDKVMERRFLEKLEQTNPSDNTKLPAFISITSFKQPLSKFSRK